MKTQDYLCQYILLENGIHEFVFHTPSHTAVDQMFEHLERLRANPPDPPVNPSRFLFDIRVSGALPMYYTYQQGAEFHKRTPPHLRVRVYVAQLHDVAEAYVFLAKNLSAIFGSAEQTTEYFRDRDQAVAWLLAQS